MGERVYYVLGEKAETHEEALEIARRAYMTNSRRKGKEGELELARILRDYGYDARRGQQYSGATGDADVIGLPGIHIEVKRVEALNLSQAMEQSIRDARAGERPVVIHRKNGEKWKVTMSLMDFIELYEGAERSKT